MPRRDRGRVRSARGLYRLAEVASFVLCIGGLKPAKRCQLNAIPLAAPQQCGCGDRPAVELGVETVTFR